MIIAGVLTAFFALVNGILGLLPQGPPPAFISDAKPLLHDSAQAAGGLSPWIPWAVAGSVAGTVLTLWVILMTIKGIRWLVAWIPTMGGS